eukprot:6214725-Pleurochrysis_carterae.AAC.7
MAAGETCFVRACASLPAQSPSTRLIASGCERARLPWLCIIVCISGMFVVMYFIPDHDASARPRCAARTHALVRRPSATATLRARPLAGSRLRSQLAHVATIRGVRSFPEGSSESGSAAQARAGSALLRQVVGVGDM